MATLADLETSQNPTKWLETPKRAVFLALCYSTGDVIGAANGLERMRRCNKRDGWDNQWDGTISEMDGTSGTGRRDGQRDGTSGGRTVATCRVRWDKRGKETSGHRGMLGQAAVRAGQGDKLPLWHGGLNDGASGEPRG